MAVEMPLSYDQMKANLRKTLGRVMAFPNLSVDLRTLAGINLSYSSSGEDLWLRQFMKSRLRSEQPGFYVDIGCNQAAITSNTFLFYCYGWRGVCVDANAAFAAEYAEFRPRDVFVQAAVTDMGQSLYLAEQDGPWGHKVARVASAPQDFGPNYKAAVVVPAMTMESILKAHVPENAVIDFLSLDIEGHELPALRSNDWARFKPRVIILEITRELFDPLAPLDFPSLRYLRDLGYQYEGFSNNNVLMSATAGA